jgi:hypothetical protein
VLVANFNVYLIGPGSIDRKDFRLTGQKRKIPDPKDAKNSQDEFLSICSASIWEVGKLIGIEI